MRPEDELAAPALVCEQRAPHPTQGLSGANVRDPKRIAATVDRLLHHAHVCQTSGESVRLSQALSGDGVTPLGGTR